MTTCDLGEVGQGQAKLPAWVDMMLHFRKAANMTLGNYEHWGYLALEIDIQNKRNKQPLVYGM